MTLEELIKLIYKQDQAFANAAQRTTLAVARGERNFVGLAKLQRSFLDNYWSGIYQHLRESLDDHRDPGPDEVGGILARLRRTFSQDLYPRAHQAGFTDSSFVFRESSPNEQTHVTSSGSRGTYSERERHRSRALVGTHVGQGSLFGHTPTDVDDELDQLHSEIMQFGQEVIAWSHQAEEKLKAEPEIKRLAAEAKEAWERADRLPATARQERIAAFKKARELQDSAADQFNQRQATFSAWDKTTWKPFLAGWIKWRSGKTDIPWQTLPGSGAWDRIQDYRQKFIETRKGAPFTPTGPEPMDADRKDPSFTSGFGDIYKLAKYGLYGALALGGIVALSSVFTNVRKGKDPMERYTELYKTHKKGR